MAKMYFTRIHLDLFDDKLNKNKTPFLLDGIKSDAASGFNEYAYKIVEVTSIDDYLTGYLVKYDPYGKGEVLDEKNGTVKQGGTKNNIIAKSLFIINVPEMILAFQENSNHLSRIMFLRMFNELFISNQKGKTFDFRITSIREQYSFVEKVKEIKSIKKISITLVPSNPSNADLWRDTDERLQENNISKYREIQESANAEGIKIDPLTEAKFAMSEDGYGLSEVTGIDNSGRNITITTKTKNQEVSHNLPSDVEKSGFLNIINYLSSTFEKIKSRTTHQINEKD